MKSLAAAHNIENILSCTYVPSSAADKELFKQQQNFAYSTFEHCLKTAKSMKFVREYEAYRDAQALYCKLLEAYQHGIQAELRQEKIKEEIQNLRLTSSWSRTFEYFLVTFEHKLLDLALITNTSISDTDKQKRLISSIHGHEQPYSAATMSIIVQQTTKNSTKVMPFDDSFSMILSTAQVLCQKCQGQCPEQTQDKQTTKANSSTKENSKKHSNSAKSSDTQFLPKDAWAKMSQEECSKHIEKFCSQTMSITHKSNQANGTIDANGSKITDSNDSTPQATSSDDASTTGPSEAPPCFNAGQLTLCQQS